MTSSIFKQEFHLKADNEQETAGVGLLSFVNISRSGVQLLKRTKAFKAVEFQSFLFPYSSVNSIWAQNVLEVLKHPEFVTIEGTEPSYFISDRFNTLIPAPLFSEKQQTKNFEFVFGELESVNVVQQTMTSSDSVGLFTIPTEIANVTGTAISSSFLTWIDAGSEKPTKAVANVLVEDHQFALVIFKEGKLACSNWFQINKADDVLYFLMAALETLKILHSEIEVVLSGNVSKSDEVHTLLNKFISKLSFSKRPKNLSYSYSFAQLPEHRYPFIFAAACA
ncbi:MAG: DUF3822 family protein [Flavobacteriales bacterium]|nr:DUF3822 family protein [Flavobacteriales bacterium]